MIKSKERWSYYTSSAVIHLYNVSRLLSALLEHQHGWSISVDVELFLQIGSL